MKSKDPPLKIRLAPEAMEWLRQAAQANCRSMNAEVNFRLKSAMADEAECRQIGGVPEARQSLPA